MLSSESHGRGALCSGNIMGFAQQPYYLHDIRRAGDRKLLFSVCFLWSRLPTSKRDGAPLHKKKAAGDGVRGKPSLPFVL